MEARRQNSLFLIVPVPREDDLLSECIAASARCAPGIEIFTKEPTWAPSSFWCGHSARRANRRGMEPVTPMQ
jgi:hypothetical protein